MLIPNSKIQNSKSQKSNAKNLKAFAFGYLYFRKNESFNLIHPKKILILKNTRYCVFFYNFIYFYISIFTYIFLYFLYYFIIYLLNLSIIDALLIF
jgi:hypothetical protein